MTVSENWGFAVFETDRYKLVVDEDAVAPCQLFDLDDDPAEDHDLLPDPQAAPIVEEIMETRVRPFYRTAPGATASKPLHRRLRRVTARRDGCYPKPRASGDSTSFGSRA